jgi:hypothetical protein
LTLKMVVPCSSKTSAELQWTMWHYITETRSLWIKIFLLIVQQVIIIWGSCAVITQNLNVVHTIQKCHYTIQGHSMKIHHSLNFKRRIVKKFVIHIGPIIVVVHSI